MNLPASTWILVLGLLAWAVTEGNAADEKKRKANFTVSMETTSVTGPLDRDGYVDYAAALNERLGKGVTPDANANVLIWKAIGPKPEGGKRMPVAYFERMGTEEPPETGEYFIDMARFARERLRFNDADERWEVVKRADTAGRRPWAATDYPHVAAWLRTNENPLNLLVEAVKRPHYFNPRVPAAGRKDSSGLLPLLLPGVQKCREMTTALVARAMLRVREGRPDEAWQDLLACLRLGRHLARGGMLIDGLVGVAVQSIAQRAALALLDRPELTAKSYQGYLADLRALPPMPPPADYVDWAERFVFLDWMMVADRRGPAEIFEGLEMGDRLLRAFMDNAPAGSEVPELRPPAGPAEDIDWDPTLRAGNRLFDRLTAALREPDRRKRQDELERIEKEVLETRRKRAGAKGKALRWSDLTPEARGRVVGDLLLTLEVPAVCKFPQSLDRHEQGERNLHVALALAAYKRDEGSYPKALGALAPKYLNKVSGDLFAGKPLVYQPSDNSYLLYSVGPNEKDDGGRSRGDNPPGDDIAVRVPVPEPNK
jgi:hypothetical protein